ncbi:glycoside hydrolase family 97 N-terminal domain-containing protein [Paenibacillus sp. CC-CFT747]|nr:glycoside hydrolase family 97 N-terminal domain-containing protein [Paenibacillus sp. CC-CFT747]
MNSGDSSWVLRSPNGGLTASIRLTPEGRLKYKVRRNKTVILEESDMGLTADGVDLGQNVLVESVRQGNVFEIYETRGGHSQAVYHGHEAILKLQHGSSGWKYGLQARACDDGFAFRYELHEEGSINIQEEASSWSLPALSRVWLFERNNAWKLKSYAGSGSGSTLTSCTPHPAKAPFRDLRLWWSFQTKAAMPLSWRPPCMATAACVSKLPGIVRLRFTLPKGKKVLR